MNLIQQLQQLTQARWFPQTATHLLAGLAAAGVVFGLRAIGVTNFVPSEVNAALTPLIGFLVAAIVRKPASGMTSGMTSATPENTVGKQVATMLMGEVAQVIDGNPALLKGLAGAALAQVLGARPMVGTQPPPAPTPPAPETPEQIGQETGVIK